MKRETACTLVLVFGLLLAGGIWSPARPAPQPCSVVEPSDISSKAQKITSGLITANQSSWSHSFSAGQVAWVVLKNSNVHLTPVDVQFRETILDPKTGKPSTVVACASRVVVPPGKTVVVKRSVFGKKISYDLEVALPNEPPIDSAVVQITVQALPAEG